jgi:alpha-beta hydrolase superfamily lysophospholipase
MNNKYTTSAAVMLSSLLLLDPGLAVAQGTDTIKDNWDKVTSKEVAFPGEGGAQLAGAVYLPPAMPRAAVVLIQGSDTDTRTDGLAQVFATQGIEALTYDKRGHGQSTGHLPGPYNVSPENLALMASDAAAAMRWLAARPELKHVATGYWGISQAGWIAPEAAAHARETDFLALWSAVAMPVSDELEEGLANGENKDQVATVRAFVGELRSTGVDPDPAKWVATLKIPSLWIYGTEDKVIPVPLALKELNGLIEKGDRNITIRINQGGGHNLNLQESRGTFDAMVEWILAQHDAG